MENKVIKIDAKGKMLGRVATQVAELLRGKNKAIFSYNALCGEKVNVVNVGKIDFSGRKLEQKKYMSHSGYLGNLRSESLKDLFKRNPEEVLRRAVYGMLPNNKLKKEWMKNLNICKSDTDSIEEK